MKRSLLFFICLTITVCLSAQTLSQAKVWFEQGRYEKALPVFRQQLKSKPSDGSLNYWYGVCLLKTGQANEALPYLEKAKGRKVQQAGWYLADARVLLGEPDVALTELDTYLSISNLSDERRDAAQRRKDSLHTYLRYLERVEDVVFIDSVRVPLSNLYQGLHLSPAAGIVLPAQSLFPRMSLEYGQAYFPERNDRVFYADTLPGFGLELVGRHRLLDGWGDPERLPEPINTEGNEFNPYFLQDGVTLYYASDGPGTLGGYDLYVSRFNPVNKTYLQPDHLNMPFNSTANEYFLLIDEMAGRGYLATDRNTPAGEVTIYTFLPNKEKVMVSGKSLKERMALADIRSLRDTWGGRNIDSLMHHSRRIKPMDVDTSGQDDEQEGLHFFVNDSLTYQRLEDFQSTEARQQMVNYLAKCEDLTITEATLSDKRALYTSQDASMRERLGIEIVALERDVRRLKQEITVLERSTRNLEIKALLK